METMTTYTATARKDGRWWVIQCAEFPGAISQVRRLDQAPDIHREAIAFVADVPIEDVEVTVTPVVPSAVQETINRGNDLRVAASEQARQATANLQSAARELHNSGWSMRDIAVVLHISHQRVQQMLVAPRQGEPVRTVTYV